MSLKLDAQIVPGAQNLDINTTYCVFSGSAISTGSDYTNNEVDGEGYFDIYNFTFKTKIPANSTTTLFSIGKNVSHDADGTKTVYGSYTIHTGIPGIETRGTNVSVDIPRIKKIATLDEFNIVKFIDEAMAISFTPTRDGWYYGLKVYISAAGVEKTLIKNAELGQFNATQQSKSFSFTASELDTIQNLVSKSSSLNVNVCVVTYSDANYEDVVGESAELTKLMYLPESLKPIINSVTITPVNTFDTADGGHVYIQGRSSVKLTFDDVITPIGTNIVQYRAMVGSQYWEGVVDNHTFNPITESGDVSIKTRVKDGRSRLGTKDYTISVHSYKNPTLTVEAYRAGDDKVRDDLTGKNILIKPTFTYSISIPGNSIVTKSVKIDGVEVATAFNTKQSLLFDGYEIIKDHTIEVTITDAVGGTATVTGKVSKGVMPFNINKDKTGVGIGKLAEAEGELQIGYVTNFFDDLLIKGVNIFDIIFPKGYQMYISDPDFDPNVKYPGTTWTRIKGVVLGAIDEDDSDTNSSTSFNQQAGTIIGAKDLQKHGHGFVGGHSWSWGIPSGDGNWIHVPNATVVAGAPSSGNVLYTNQGDWNKTNEVGVGECQNIQPTMLTYVWEKTS